MLRRSQHLSAARSTALSPYAAALKHVALRGGKAALGTTSKEEELRLARAGALPADYRPPPTTAWDDTVERWAFAWQFPVSDAEPSASIKVVRNPALMGVVDIAKRLLEEPAPSKAPNKAKVEQQRLEQAQREQEFESRLLSNTEEQGQEQQQQQDDTDSSVVAGKQTASSTNDDIPMLSASEFTALLPPDTQLPVAYVYDGSDFSAICRQLGTIMVDELGLPFDDDGLKTVVAAVGKRTSPQQALALFRFALDAGFRPSTTLYGAAMVGFALRGNTQPCHDLIEEMKEKGITPGRGNWTLLMMAYSLADDHGAVLQIAENMKSFANIEPDETVFAHQLRALGRDQSRESNPFEAVQLFDQMENVYGYVPNRTLYHAYMSCLYKRAGDPGLRQKLNDTAAKMELVGIPWDSVTYHYLIGACVPACRSSPEMAVARARELCAKMRSEGLVANVTHLGAVIRVYTSSMRYRCQTLYREAVERGDADTVGKERVLAVVQHHSATVLGIIKLVQSRNNERRRGDDDDDGTAAISESSSFVDFALGFNCAAVEVLCNYAPDAGEHITKFEEQAKHIWQNAYDENAFGGNGSSSSSRRRGAAGGDDDDSRLSFRQRRALGLERFEGESSVPGEQEDEEQQQQQQPRTVVIAKSAVTYDLYISMLSAQQRIDEAENLFQELTILASTTSITDAGIYSQPLRSTYERMILLHLLSGEEGAAHRALNYMDAMTKSGLAVRPHFLKRMRRAADGAAYRRDMKRRARRIVQAREEYLARKQAEAEKQEEEMNWQQQQQQEEQEEGDVTTTTAQDKSSSDTLATTTTTTTTSAPPNAIEKLEKASSSLASIAPFHPSNRAGPDTVGQVSTWWKHWELNTVSKHELFDAEKSDGTPAGESFAEKNAALRKMGIESKFVTRADVPRLSEDKKALRTSLLARIRREDGLGSEPVHALWNLDGADSGDDNLPSGFDSTSSGWAATLWQERQVLRKELEATRDGVSKLDGGGGGGVSSSSSSSSSSLALGGGGTISASPTKQKPSSLRLSSAGNAVRPAPEQLAIEQSGAKTHGELLDAQEFPEHVYEDGTAKPASEFAAPVSAAGETVWQAELRDELAPFKKTSELYPAEVSDVAAAAVSATEEEDATMQSENIFMRGVAAESDFKTQQVIDAIKNKQEDTANIEQTLGARHKKRALRNPGKTDFLHKWRNLYRQGVLEMKDEPVWDTRDPATNRANAMKAALAKRKQQQ